MKKGLVSVIMPAYNSEKYIGEAIASVLAQNYEDWELLIINDASTDNTGSIIKYYSDLDKRVKAFTLSQNAGVANARNVGIKNANGQYIAFLDSDDFWYKNKLEKQIAYMQANNVAFSYHNFRILNISNGKEKIVTVPKKLDYKGLLKGNNTGSCVAVCIDRNIVKNIFMPADRQEDYICWLNILKEHNLIAHGIDYCLSTYRVGKLSLSSNKLKSALWTWKVYRESQNLSIIKSVYYMFFYIIQGLMKYK